MSLPPCSPLSLEVVESLQAPAQVRQALQLYCRKIGLGADDTQDLTLIASELATNAVRHGASPRKVFQVLAYREEQTVTLQVIDHGPGFAPDLDQEPGSLREDLDGGERYGGWGLPLVRSLAELTIESVQPTGTRVTVRRTLVA